MAGRSLNCEESVALLSSVEEALEHAELSHSNSSECTEAVLYFFCTACAKPCQSKTESYSHAKRTGHNEFTVKTRKVAAELEDGGDASASTSGELVPEVNKNMLKELEALGFPTARATRALYYSGNASLEAAVDWVVEHDNDPELDQMPSVSKDTNVEAQLRSLILEQLSILKELRRRLECVPEDPSTAKPPAPVEEKQISLPVRPASKAVQMRECLRSLKSNHEEDAKVKRAFQTLLTYVESVKRNPGEEKFRKIRLSNRNFQERVGALRGGIEFLEVCGFEKIDGGEFLFLPKSKVDMAVLNSAVSELVSPLNNPFCGIL